MELLSVFQDQLEASDFPDYPSPPAAPRHNGGKFFTLGQVCEILQIPTDEGMAADSSLFPYVHRNTGQFIHHMGDACENLFLIHSGFLKTVAVDSDGNEKVLDFPMKGDLIGIDGIEPGRYATHVTTLSSCGVILLPLKKIVVLSREYPALRSALCSAFSRRFNAIQRFIGRFHSLSAEARVARFLVSLSDNYGELGYSSKTFSLRMTRRDIGSYLGLSMETVSRAFSVFHELGHIEVHMKEIGILNVEALRTLRRIPTSIVRAQRKRNGRYKKRGSNDVLASAATFSEQSM